MATNGTILVQVDEMPQVKTRVPVALRGELLVIARANDRTLAAEIRRALRLYVAMMRERDRAPETPAA